MLDQEDLQAIQAMIEAMEQRTEKKLETMEQRIDQKLETMEQRIDQKLETMEQRIDQKLETMEQRTDQKLETVEQRITKNTVALMDMEFSKKFNLLAEGIEAIQEKLVPRSRVDDLEDEVKFLKSMIRQMNEDLQKLKKAN